MKHHQPLTFGIYPGGEAGSDAGVASGPADDPDRIEHCLDVLQGNTRPFVVRVYERYSDPDHPSRWKARTPPAYERYARTGRPLDLVVMFQSVRGDIASYLEFVRHVIRRNAQHLYSVQITEEANFVDGPDAIDGPYLNVRRALVEGVIAARCELDQLGRRDVEVGFSVTPTFGPGAEFWREIGAGGGEAFHEALGYVGFDFFPDVFRPVASGDLRSTTLGVLDRLRGEWMPSARIAASVPIHIAENGWPTGPTRSYERQAQVVETIIRTVDEARERLNIERYTMFDLRDTDSNNPELENDIFYHFGITRDDYTPKPAFETYRRLIAELGGARR